MNSNERRLIQDLFDRLAAAEGQRRDAETERLIASEMQRVPHAPYAMAQTIVAQNQALEEAARRIEALENGADEQATAPGAMGAPDPGRRVPSFGRGDGFLANAGQVALGVAGGMLLGEAAKSLLGSGSEARAAPGDQTGADDTGADAGAGEAAGGGGFFDWLFGGDAANDSGHDMADTGWDEGGWDGGE